MRKIFILNLVLISISIFFTQILQASKDNKNKNLTRSITASALGADANVTTFLGANQFYIGSATNAEKSLSRVAISIGDDGNLAATFMPMAPAAGDVIINIQMGQNSPFNAQEIKNLTLGSDVYGYQHPIVGLVTGTDPNQMVQIYQVTDTILGKSILTNADMYNTVIYPLNTTTTTTPAKGLHALAATQKLEATQQAPFIFSLVSDNTTLDTATTTSIGVIPSSVGLVNINPLDGTNFNNFGPQNKAVPIHDALTITTAPSFIAGANASAMVWDDVLQKLFIVFSGVQTAPNTADTVNGAVALLIGKIVSTSNGNNPPIYSLKIEKCANLVNNTWPTTKDRIVGCQNRDDTTQSVIKLYNIGIMHTSTGRDYTIINGEIAQTTDTTATDSTKCVVYALPVMPQGSTDQQGNDTAGKLAKPESSTGTFQQITTAEALIKDSDKQAIVGANPYYLAHGTIQSFQDAQIQNMQISGDTVFVALAGTRGNSKTDTAGEAGIFASTAIFANNGTIRTWTPWQRVMGYIDKAYGFGFDTSTNNFWYVGPDKQTAKVTIWSSGDTRQDGIHAGSPLSIALQNFFFQEYLGVVNLVNFDDETVGFKPWDPKFTYPAFSMMVALGYNTVALIQTGAKSNVNDNTSAFTPTASYVANLVGNTPPPSTTNVFVFNNLITPATGTTNPASSVTQPLGFITTAEVSRIGAPTNYQRTYSQTQGWLFIGGQNGVAVLCQNGGAGWNSTTGFNALTNTGFPGTGYSFIQLTPPANIPAYNFSNVQKLVSDGTYLYILTITDLYRLKMDSRDFINFAIIDPSRITRIAGIDNAFKDESDNQVMNKYIDRFFDLMVINQTDNAKVLAIATTQGVWVSSTITNNFSLNNLTWNRNIGQTGDKFTYLGPALKFDFVSVNRGWKTTNSTSGQTTNKYLDGNLYVTAIDYRFGSLIVCRFDVQNGTLRVFNEPYNDQGIYTPYFYELATLGDIFKGIQFGQLDHVGRYGQLSDSIGVIPDPINFLPTALNNLPYYAAINLGMDPQTALHLFQILRETASGALYIPGEFNVFVNE